MYAISFEGKGALSLSYRKSYRADVGVVEDDGSYEDAAARAADLVGGVLGQGESTVIDGVAG